MSAPPAIDPGFCTDEMVSVFSNDARVRRMLQVEQALAQAQAKLGLIPQASAAAIALACGGALIDGDADALLRQGWEAGTPVVPLLALLRSRVPAEHAVHLHHGATSQDVVDLATVLQLQAGIALLERSLVRLAQPLRKLADAHRGTAIMGRTLLQQAQPRSFGLTLAGWLAPLISASAELSRARRALPVQLGGPVGALSDLDGQGIALTEALASALDLQVPVLPWHGDRTPILAAVFAVDLAVRAALKLSNDLVLLAQTELGEVRMRGGGSSSMPHKQNPIDAVRAVAAGEACLRLSAGLVSARTHELERAAGAWHMEWLFVPLVFYTASAALAAAGAALESLQVDGEQMRLHSGDSAMPAADTLIDRALASADAHWGALTP